MQYIVNLLEKVSSPLVHLAESFAKDNQSPKIEPAHFFRAVLHKSAGLVSFIEDTLDEDYYYLLDWSDIRVRQCDKSPYGMKGVELSKASEDVLRTADTIRDKFGAEEIIAEYILAALVSPGVGFTAEQLKTMPLKVDKILAAIGPGKATGKEAVHTSQTKTVSEGSSFSTLMTDRDLSYEIIGFDSKLRAIQNILARKDRANIMIVGESGVGKTALLNAIVKKVASGQMPESLSAAKLYELDLIMISQGVSYKGEVEDRFKKELESISSAAQPILVIENIHRIEDRQSLLSALLPILKKTLAKNEIQMICTTTVDGYTKDIEPDKEILPFFEKISLDEPSVEMAVEILTNRSGEYERFHHLQIEPDVPAETVRLAKRYMPERRLPSSAIDLLDRAMASKKISLELGEDKSNKGSLETGTIQEVVSQMTGIPMGNVRSEERSRLENGEEILHRRVVGQNHAIRSILDAVFESRSGLSKKGQPMGSFFFLGPTGTGKTELAKSLAEFLFNDETSILRFDMSEYKEEHSVALLYGAPPGYVGYEEGGLLVNQIRQHPYSVVLFDEIEKAHRSVFDLFLQILDEGKLHDRLGRVGDFSNALIIFTSNIGSDFIFKSFAEGKVPSHDTLLEVMQGNFRPEFLARITEIVPFSPITEEMIDRIFDIHLKNLLKTLEEQKITLSIDETARKYVTSVGFNAHYGARPILGIIRKEIRRPLSKMIVAGDIGPGDHVLMKYDPDKKEIVWEIESDNS